MARVNTASMDLKERRGQGRKDIERNGKRAVLEDSEEKNQMNLKR